VVSGATTDDIGKLAYSSKIPVLELASHSASLEQAFLELTEGAAEYEAHTKGVKQ
jgi:ABC-2 type transport system ATP-binding protein